MSNPRIAEINGIPALGFGTWPLSGQGCINTVKMAVEVGFRHIDTAQMYQNEPEVGEAIASCGVPRGQLFVTTKVDPSNLGKNRFAQSVRRSMDLLGGPADLLLIHWPPADADVDATLARLKAEQERGMAKRIGVSNFSPKLLRQAVARLGPDIACNQVEDHPLLDQRKLKATADELGVPLVAYSPIARGRALSHSVITDIARRLSRPPSEIVLRWIYQSGVIAIPMTSKRENALSNINIFSYELSTEDMAAISAIGSEAGRTIAPSRMQGRWDG